MVTGCPFHVTHRAYSRVQNARRAVTGHQWANRFFSTALDAPHLWAAVSYVEGNPVRAGLVTDAIDYRWSSARAHAGLIDDALLDGEDPFPGPVSDWRAWLAIGLEEETARELRENTRSGQPSGKPEGIPRGRGGSGGRIPVPETGVRETSPYRR
jgi:putative transposase